MNERIKELIEESYDLAEYNYAPPQKIFNKEKFAELIVRECDRVLSEDDGATHHSELLFTHFGVEE